MHSPKRNLLMDNYIRIYEDVIDEDSCQLVIDKFEKNQEQFEKILIENGDSAISFKQINM